MWGSDCQPAACCCCFSFLPFTGDDTPSELHHPLSSCCFRPALKGREKKKRLPISTFIQNYTWTHTNIRKPYSTKPGAMWGKGPIMHDNADGHKFSVPSENSAHQIPPTTICSPYTYHCMHSVKQFDPTMCKHIPHTHTAPSLRSQKVFLQRENWGPGEYKTEASSTREGDKTIARKSDP